MNTPLQAKLASIWLVDGVGFSDYEERMTVSFLSATSVKQNLISNPEPPDTLKVLNIGVAFSSVILFLHCKQNKKKVPFVFHRWPHFWVQHCSGVRAGNCPGCRGLSQRSWCLSLNRRRCARPRSGFSPVLACGWHWGEPADPGSQNGRAFRQMGPWVRRRGMEIINRQWLKNIITRWDKT